MPRCGWPPVRMPSFASQKFVKTKITSTKVGKTKPNTDLDRPPLLVRSRNVCSIICQSLQLVMFCQFVTKLKILVVTKQHGLFKFSGLPNVQIYKIVD